MSLKLYMDVHVPLAITKGLRSKEIEVLRAQDDGYGQADDRDIIKRATFLGFVVCSQDSDFLREASLLQQKGIHFSGVIFAHQLQITIGQSIRDLELICKTCEPDDLINRVEFLPLQ